MKESNLGLEREKSAIRHKRQIATSVFGFKLLSGGSINVRISAPEIDWVREQDTSTSQPSVFSANWEPLPRFLFLSLVCVWMFLSFWIIHARQTVLVSFSIIWGRFTCCLVILAAVTKHAVCFTFTVILSSRCYFNMKKAEGFFQCVTCTRSPACLCSTGILI